MKVVYVEPLGVEGGMGGYNEAFLKALLDAGHSVVVVGRQAFPGARLVRKFGWATDRTRPRIVRAISYASALLRAITLAVRAEVWIAHIPHVPLLDTAALRFVQRLGRTAIVIAHDPQPMALRRSVRTDAAYYRAACRCLVHGARAAADLAAYGIPESKILVGGFGDYLPRTAMTHDEAAAALGIDATSVKGPVVALIGNLKPEKGVRRVLAAAKGPRWQGTLLLAGSPQGDPDLLPELERMRSDQLLCFPRRLSAEEECAVYSLADVVLAPYVRAYSSGVISTAHAFGRPVVLSDVGDLRAQMAPGDVLLPSDAEADDIAEAIAKARPAEAAKQLEPWDRNVVLVESVLCRRPSPG